jgi:hypothetical protein
MFSYVFVSARGKRKMFMNSHEMENMGGENTEPGMAFCNSGF